MRRLPARQVMILGTVLLLAGPLLAQQQVVIVDIRDFAFEPRDTRILVDTAVRWINHDDSPHSIAMEGGRPGSSGLIAPMSDYTFTFRDAGMFTYRCAVHPTMLGVLIVDPR